MVDTSHSRDTLARHNADLRQENKRLKQSLQNQMDSSGQFRFLVQSASDAIFRGDAAGNIIYANDSASTLSCYNNPELLAMNLEQLFSAEEHHRAPLQYDLLKRGETVKIDRLLSRKDGTTVPVEMNSRMMADGSYHSFIRDISERKQADEALRISEEKFSRAFKLSPDVIVISRLRDGMYLEVNQGFTESLGWTADEAVGRRTLPGDLDIWCHTEDRQRLVEMLKNEGQVVGLKADFRHKNGSVIVGLMSARIIEIDGEACLLAVTRDITEQVQAKKKQKRLEEQMLQVQKLESLGVLAGGIAHDFNNILMAVIGHCELAQRRLTVESPAMENLRQIRLAAARAADLANQMLAYSGKGKFVIEILDFSQIIAEMEHILAVSISKKATIRYSLASNLPSVEADATQLRQIVMNLVMNGSEAIGNNGGIVAVSTGTMECDSSYLQEVWLDENLLPGRYVFLEVADTGCGMEAETVSRIFEPFFSTKFTGRGLGMAAVLGIVRGHKGAIKIYTEVGKGSTFKVLLPVSSLHVSRQDADIQEAPLQESGLVLLVDDEEILLEVGREMLNDFGFETMTAVDGKKALAIFRQHYEDIRFVLMDLTMPNMDGEEAFREFRLIDPEVKVIICSGYNEQEISQKFAGKGLAGFLKKPFQLSELQKIIQHILG